VARFKDQRLLEIYLYGRTLGVPAEECIEIQGKLEILLAMRGWTSVGLLGDPFLITTGRIAIMFREDWAVSFEWWDGQGALEMQLEP
jgi:hypothetical protein